MSVISNSDVQRLADLSGLQLADGEVDGLRQDVEKIVEYINQLGELARETRHGGRGADLSSDGSRKCLA